MLFYLLITGSLMLAALKDGAEAAGSRFWLMPFRWKPQYLDR